MNCPTCGDRLHLAEPEWHRWNQATHVEWKRGRADLGYEPCEGCAQDAALDAMCKRTPWLFDSTDRLADDPDTQSHAVSAGHYWETR